ncbi:apoptosis regulatory protein Siva [Diachasma alloeum]|uniref:apoptosis regulatory protein Siva n=1 Tax=Diachasma alloeum TaxID=454923 RepID=UPI0007381447|nr:apoptosis regulatory protein Siva [Diachasma alloeum]
MSSKRICPFDEDLTPQMKVHIGLKEATDIAERNEEMKRIYERTLRLLRNGSQKLIGKRADNAQNPTKGVGYHFEPPRLKQMVMNDKLELEHSKKIILPQAQQTCSSCRELKVYELNRCFHCIEFYCPYCLNECTKCSEQFCSKCSFIIYEGDEHVECLNCYH